MGITYLAINHTKKEFIEPPNDWGNKTPQIYQDNNPFCRMVCYLLDCDRWSGDKVEIIGDCSLPCDFFDEDGGLYWKDITKMTLKELMCLDGEEGINIYESPRKAKNSPCRNHSEPFKNGSIR